MLLPHSFLTLILCFITPLATAGTVVKISGKKVYIVFDPSEGGTFQKDDYFNLTNKQGKKVGVVELTKVQGYKAVGLLKKGRASQGNSTQFRSVGKKDKMKKLDASAANKKSGLFEDDEELHSSSPQGRVRWGLQIGYGTAKQDVEQDTGTSTQSGSSLALKGLLDYPLLKTVSLQGGAGVEKFSVSGTGKNAQTQITNVEISSEITFLTTDALLKWSAYKGHTSQFYLLGGMGIFYPLSKSSDSIDSGTISTIAVGEFGLGFEFSMGGLSIPVDLTYYLFPKSTTVSTSIISFKVGVYF